MVVLTYVPTTRWSLIATTLFVLAFVVTMAFATRASNYELLAATAAYSAVLVVFVSNALEASTSPII